MIKRVLTFVSGVQEYVLVDFRSQNKVKILHTSKTKIVLSKFSYENDQIYILFYILLNF